MTHVDVALKHHGVGKNKCKHCGFQTGVCLPCAYSRCGLHFHPQCALECDALLVRGEIVNGPVE